MHADTEEILGFSVVIFMLLLLML